MSRFEYRLCDSLLDRTVLTGMLFAIKDDLCLPNREVVESIIDKIFAHGGAVGVFEGNLMVAMMGYFIGDPAEKFANPDIGFMYVAGILPSYRGTRIFHEGLLFSLSCLEALGCSEVRLQAEASQTVTNKLYSRFAQFQGKSRSLRGDVVNSYGGPIEDALNYLQRHRINRKKTPATS